MANKIEEILGTAASIAKGMGITFKEMMGPTVTDDYPDAPPKFEERFRGVHVLQRDVNGMEKCVACFLCAAACPSNCIYIEAAENTATTRISGGERYAKVYNIDYNRCIFCGYCVEACPTDAITHGHGFEVASYNTSTLVKRKEDMLAAAPAGAKPPVMTDEMPAGLTKATVFRAIREQIDTIFREDPAAKSVLEIFLCYPGFHAILSHRVAHCLYRWGVPLAPRVLSQISRFFTGIEIHPGATIGRRFFIDHGSGVVIGETTEIGDDVLLYQGVTLGGTGNERGKRHPTLGNRVVVGTGAKVLGNIRIGDNVKVGAGSVVVHPVPDNSTVVGIPGRVVRVRPEEGALEHGRLPDPEGQAIDDLARRVAELEDVLRKMIAEHEVEHHRK